MHSTYTAMNILLPHTVREGMIILTLKYAMVILVAAE